MVKTICTLCRIETDNMMSDNQFGKSAKWYILNDQPFCPRCFHRVAIPLNHISFFIDRFKERNYSAN